MLKGFFNPPTSGRKQHLHIRGVFHHKFRLRALFLIHRRSFLLLFDFWLSPKRLPLGKKTIIAEFSVLYKHTRNQWIMFRFGNPQPVLLFFLGSFYGKLLFFLGSFAIFAPSNEMRIDGNPYFSVTLDDTIPTTPCSHSSSDTTITF